MKKPNVKVLLVATLLILFEVGCNQVSVYSTMQNIERKNCLDAGVSPVECSNRTANSFPAHPAAKVSRDAKGNSDPLTPEIDRALNSERLNPSSSEVKGSGPHTGAENRIPTVTLGRLM
jgi:hypothetical protein